MDFTVKTAQETRCSTTMNETKSTSIESEVEKTRPDKMKRVRFSIPAGEDKDLESGHGDFISKEEKTTLQEPEGAGVCWTVVFRIYLVFSIGFGLTYLLFVMLVGPGRTWNLLEHFVNIST